MRIVSFNVNGIRARPHQLQALRDIYSPHIIGLQETKVQDPEFPLAVIGELGYQASFYGQKSHYGVALLSALAPTTVRNGLPGEQADAQRRLITGIYQTPKGETLTVINGYFPQGESRNHPIKFPHKRRFYAELLELLRSGHSPQENLLLIGDMNVAPLDQDIGIGADNAKRWLQSGKCSFLPEEREWLQALQNWGLQDCFRAIHPDSDDQFSWFDYRSRGFEQTPRRGLRIDLLLATGSLMERIRDAGIAYDIRAMTKPSDHCPIWVDLDI